MKIYYIEYENSVKFFYKENNIEIIKGNKLIIFLKAVYKKYKKGVKFECLV